MQHSFSKSAIFSALLMLVLVVGAHLLLGGMTDRETRPEATAAVRFEPAVLDPSGFAPLTLAGAWHVTSAESRMGGVSAVAVDHGGLLALTDSGVTIRLPKPASANRTARFSDLPAGPGWPSFKAGRDSEAIARDWAGRGWWVMFESRHSAWLFDRDLRHPISVTNLDSLGWSSNLGAEGAVSTAGGLLLFPERGNEVVRLTGGHAERNRLINDYGHLSDATMLPDGRIVVIARSYSPLGFSARLLLFDRGRLRPLARLALGRLDNAEGIATEPLPGGGTRFWIMTDNDLKRRVPTLLIALDWQGAAPVASFRPRPDPSLKSRA